MRYKTAASWQRKPSRQDRIALTRAMREALTSAECLRLILERQGREIPGLIQMIEGLKREDLSARGAD